MCAYSPSLDNDIAASLQELDDPAFFAHWAALRNQLALTPESSPERPKLKRRYNAAVTEYHRRIAGTPSLPGQ